MNKPLNMITASVGGQGNIVASEIIGSVCAENGRKVTIGETHGLSQRGGSVVSYIRVSDGFQYGPMVPLGEADLILGFEPLEALKVFLRYGNKNTTVLLNDRPNLPTTVLSGLEEYPEVADMIAYFKEHAGRVVTMAATELAREAGNTVAMNVVMVGALAATGTLRLPREEFERVIRQTFDEKKHAVNLKAFALGYKTAAAQL